jgi:hypothetical protein
MQNTFKGSVTVCGTDTHRMQKIKKTDSSQDTGRKLISNWEIFQEKNYFPVMEIAGTSEMLI